MLAGAFEGGAGRPQTLHKGIGDALRLGMNKGDGGLQVTEESMKGGGGMDLRDKLTPGKFFVLCCF